MNLTMNFILMNLKLPNTVSYICRWIKNLKTNVCNFKNLALFQTRNTSYE